MAGNGKRGAGDRVLESRHLIGLFLGVVLLCSVFFTLGYVMGRTQYGGSVHAETITPHSVPAPVAPQKNAQASPTPTPAPSEWDFYNKKPNPQLTDAIPPKPAVKLAEDPVSEPAAPAPLPVEKPAPSPAKVRSTAAAPAHVPKPSIVLQVAALRRESDAVEMARLLQKKHFPSFVSAPLAGDTLYRVQVGPYSDERAADAAKGALDHAGFKAIIKH